VEARKSFIRIQGLKEKVEKAKAGCSGVEKVTFRCSQVGGAMGRSGESFFKLRGLRKNWII
jgi:hypothetical protein